MSTRIQFSESEPLLVRWSGVSGTFN